MKEINVFIKERLLFILIIILFIVSGCAIIDRGKDLVGWEDEILLAKECGMDGLRCCLDEPSCYYGQVCCTSPNDPDLNYCADDCQFGKEGAFCRESSPQCDIGTACRDYYCLSCGQENQICCDQAQEQDCAGGLLCYKDKCVQCGLAGNPCCQNGKACADEDKNDETHTECRDGVCVYCGNNGKVACESQPQCLPGHLLNNGVCLNCGQPNQPCCDENISGYECEGELICNLGFCSQ